MFGNKNWFAFQDDSRSKQPLPSFLISPPSQRVEDEQVTNVVSPPHSSGGSSSDDEVVVGEDEDLADTATSPNSSASAEPSFEQRFDKGPAYNGVSSGDSTATSIEDISTELEKLGLSDNLFSFNHAERNVDLFASKSVDWEGSQEHADSEGTSGRVSAEENVPSEAPLEKVDGAGADLEPSLERAADFEVVDEPSLDSMQEASPVLAENHDDPTKEAVVPLFGGPSVVGVEPEGTALAMKKALKEGIVGEAGPIMPDVVKEPESEGDEPDTKVKDVAGNPSFNDVNFWRSDYDQSVAEDDIKDDIKS
jgi:serine/threonine-protein phosphatase 6 regulatory subunit 3